jgi:secreted PhoX family phosphatase
LDRRRFLASIAAAASTPVLAASCAASRPQASALQTDRRGLLDLPKGFSYRVVSRAGESMADGLLVPGAHDGMAVFGGSGDHVTLICNHELTPGWIDLSGLADRYADLPEATRRKFYDRGSDTSPGLGGTTTTLFNTATGKTERQFLSLAGTENNCAGGRTPWNSWLSCEETFAARGQSLDGDTTIFRDKDHGYVFEVPAAATGLTEARPIKAMGRFEHEAAAVHASSGIVYMTEDRHFSLFYRYIPDVPGELHRGGRLQALAVADEPSMATHNWGTAADVPLHKPFAVRWIDLEDVDSDRNDLRLRGARAGAATFARGEGLCAAGEEFAFTCTSGGLAELGQVFVYRPSRFEGTDSEQSAPATLRLIAEAQEDSILRNADNLTMSPWGDLIVCEDTAGHCGLVGIRPDGSMYPLADNPHSDSELAGVCFSADGETLFVNIQYPGVTLAISGPWPRA